MAQLEVLQANFDNMKENFLEQKENFIELKKEVKDIVPQITKILKDEYVSKVEYDNKMSVFRWILGIATAIIVGVIMFYVNYQLQKLGK